MTVVRDIQVTVKEGDMELRMGKALTSFTYKGQEKFTFRSDEIVPLIAMLQSARYELNEFYPEKATP